ncbi:MAG TPA: A/G-specific adenine glycosylase [Tepidisphaeraceae bacterium]|jgi:A/G-specific adenine glycosylase
MIATAAEFRTKLLKWYRKNRRDLPWRVAPEAPRNLRPDPYLVLVSELMLQQTQVATVIPYFNRFTQRFPTAHALAEADEQEVLRHWQGLGYYSRARNLHAAAREISRARNGRFPRDVQALLQLPGVGRYTAGAIASIAFDEPAPIVDGNVGRVLARVDRIEKDLTQPAIRGQLWTRAEELVRGNRPGDFNSAMMELGATVCTPRSPKCLLCPVAGHCEALAAGVQEKLPLPKKRVPTPLLKRDVLCVRYESKWLIEQRPAKGRWASMWQFVTTDRNGTYPDCEKALGCRVRLMEKIGLVTHGLTHRRYEFDVWVGELSHAVPTSNDDPSRRVWVGLDELSKYPMSRPQVKVAQMLRQR